MRSTEPRSIGYYFIALGVGMMFGMVLGGYTSVGLLVGAISPIPVGVAVVAVQHIREVRAEMRQQN
ncbi:MAG: hypothetical protein WDZ44_00725 [Candidatus Spechtbacterales bacterium]